MECLLPYLCMVTVPHIMVRLERMLDYRGVGLERFHCIHSSIILVMTNYCVTQNNNIIFVSDYSSQPW